VHCNTTGIHHAIVETGHTAEAKAAKVAETRPEILILHRIYSSVFDVTEEAIQIVVSTLARALHRVVLVCRHAVLDGTIAWCSCSCRLSTVIAAVT